MAINPSEMNVSVQISRLDKEISEVKLEYEQYFMGMVRIAPSARRKKIQRSLMNIGGRPINNSALRFKFQQLRARFNTYQTYWNRVMNQIETGKYVREERRYQLKQKQKQKQKSVGADDKAEKKPAKAKSKEDRSESIYNDFIASRKQCGERTDNVSVDRLSKFISQQETQLKSQYGNKAIDFKVVVENGKTKLRAILKK